MVLHPRQKATLAEIERDWSLDDMAAAHLALDLIEDAEILADLRLNPPK